MPKDLKIRRTLVGIIISLFVVACVSTTGVENTSLYGKWTLNKVVDEDGDFIDFTNHPGNFVHIKQSEVSEIIAGHGVRTYPFTQEGDVLTLISGGVPINWIIVASTEGSLELDTPIGRYSLSR